MLKVYGKKEQFKNIWTTYGERVNISLHILNILKFLIKCNQVIVIR